MKNTRTYKFLSLTLAALFLSTTFSVSQSTFAITSPSSTQKKALISLNFSEIEVRKLLQILAQFSDVNFVISEGVTGSMSIHLKNVTWTTALDVILKAEKLGQLKVGGALLIAPAQEIADTRLAELQAQEKLDKAEPLTDKIIFLKYADAPGIAKMLTEGTKPLISAQGQIKADLRTNSVWIRDTPIIISSLQKLIAQIDYPVRQVEIDARIVTIDRDYEKQLGTRLGLTNPYNMSGSLTGANALNTLSRDKNFPAGGTAGIANQYYNSADKLGLSDRLGFDVPAGGQLFSTAETVNPGRLAVSLLKVGHNFLDLELSAIEGERHAMDLASPHLIASNNEEAVIRQGKQLPYQTTGANGASQLEYAAAYLELKITPLITPDNHIRLKILVKNNRPGESIVVGNSGSAITIDMEEESSNVLLNDNETIVIGGIYKQTKGNKVIRIPYLGDLPFIGRLFSYKEDTNFKQELLIFLTPHIVNKPSELSPDFIENGQL